MTLNEPAAEQTSESAEVRSLTQHAKEDFEAANRAKTQFLANMSHEFRTPVAAVVGYAEMLLDPHLSSDEQLRVIHAIKRNGAHLLALINDVLDLSKIDAGKMTLERVPCRLWHVVGEALSGAGVAAQEKKLDIHMAPVGQLPRVVTTDPTRLRQILDNLLSNAVKFTPAGKQVEIRLRLEESDRAQPRLIIEVEDQGIGMNQAVMSRLFQPFTQADPSTTRRYGGTGLGLSICKRLAENLGGSIAVRSAPGVGTCFTVALPLSPNDMFELLDEHEFAQESMLIRPRPGTARRKLIGRVLLAEDSPDNQTIARYFLEQSGLSVEVAETGREAMDRALASDFDVILMDMQMPEMDGYTAAAELRNRGYSRPIVALTAHAMTGDEEKCLAAGCSGYLTKPVDADRLLKVVAQHLPARSWSVRTADLTRTPRPIPAPSLPTASTMPSLANLSASYRRSLPEKFQGIAEAEQAGQLDRLAGLAHRLRGSAGMYGLPEISQTAGELEDACRRSDDVNRLAALTRDLGERCTRAAAL